MALPVEINPLHLQTSGGYSIAKSLRVRGSATAYLNRTPSVAGNAQKFTWSGWVKRGSLSPSSGSGLTLIGAGGTAGTGLNQALVFHSAYTINFSNDSVGSATTNAIFRDPSAWYHVVLAVDTTQATTNNRAIVYVNGVLQSWSSSVPLTQNQNTAFNTTTAHTMGKDPALASNYFDGYLAEVNFIDGQALTPSSFGAYDTNGVWQPAKYTGTYGTNGFYLPFTNTTSTATLGNDFSGNSNTWTVNNISLTAGSTYDSMNDSPTVSSTTVGNYAVMNPVFGTPSTTYSNGNLTLTRTGSVDVQAASTFAMPSGKFYWEYTVSTLAASTNLSIGIMKNTQTSGVNSSSTPFVYWNGNGNAYRYGTNLGAVGTTFAAGNILGFALDMTAGTISLYKNNTLISTTSSVDTTIPHYVFWDSYASGDGGNYNFGQQPFTYTPPTGYNALNTYNLPTPAIPNGAKYMSATTYAGSASTQVINSNMTALDFAWIKDRTSARSHVLVDTVRGGSPMLTLYSDLTSAEDNSSANYNPTSISGSSITLGGAKLGINNSGDNYVLWGWRANAGTNVSNTNGSITSTVSANTTAGFSIVTYTGTGASNPTIGHGLGVTPNMIILKDRNTNTNNNNWQVYHSSLTSGYFLSLNTTDAQAAISGTSYGSVGQPTSTTFKGVAGSVDSTTTNQNTQLYVAYCFAAVTGYSAFGSYTGNGSTDGPFVYCGFRPRWIMAKDVTNTTSASWLIQDTSRDTYNVGYKSLYAEQTSVESVSSADNVDILSNGFKIRNASSAWNNSGQTFIYMAFAENPFQSSRAR